MSEPTKLFIVWSSADRDVALQNVFMYTHYSKKMGWWEVVRLIVWGPSDMLLVKDAELQEQVKEMIKDGVEVMACKACTDALGVTEQLEQLGVKVFYVGELLTGMLKDGWASLTY